MPALGCLQSQTSTKNKHGAQAAPCHHRRFHPGRPLRRWIATLSLHGSACTLSRLFPASAGRRYILTSKSTSSPAPSRRSANTARHSPARKTRRSAPRPPRTLARSPLKRHASQAPAAKKQRRTVHFGACRGMSPSECCFRVCRVRGGVVKWTSLGSAHVQNKTFFAAD